MLHKTKLKIKQTKITKMQLDDKSREETPKKQKRNIEWHLWHVIVWNFQTNKEARHEKQQKTKKEQKRGRKQGRKRVSDKGSEK